MIRQVRQRELMSLVGKSNQPSMAALVGIIGQKRRLAKNDSVQLIMVERQIMTGAVDWGRVVKRGAGVGSWPGRSSGGSHHCLREPLELSSVLAV